MIYSLQIMSLWKNRDFVLSNKVHLPSIGLGTFKIKGQASVDLSVKAALKAGYRLIGTRRF